jgi:hypothetical protein
MTTKRVAIGGRPGRDRNAEHWIQRGERAGAPTIKGTGTIPDSGCADLYTARLTIDVTPVLRGRIKVAAFRQGLTVAEMLRALFEREFPDTGDDA